MAKSFKIGVFDSEEKFISSLKLLKEKKFPVFDVFTPYPVHEVFHILRQKTRLPLAGYLFGLFGAIGSLSFLYYTSVISWPIVYGGKPFNSFPSFMVVTIVLTIFTVTILGLLAFSARSKLFPGRDNTIFDHRATDNRFLIVIEADAQDKTTADAVSLMQENGAVEVLEKEFENVKL